MKKPKTKPDSRNIKSFLAPPDKNLSGEHWRFCPQCGHELVNEKCKLRCPRCHYFMSCSDFDFAG
jgi:hypothetical protein